MRGKLKFAFLAGAGLAVAAMLAADWVVRSSAEGRTYSDASLIPHRKVGVVLGCSRSLPDGRDNLFFKHRAAAAARLFNAGKVDYLIVSGDNHVAGYDETTDMKLALAAAGVPERRIYCDYAGFRTLDSMVRAKAVFGQTSVTVVSQEFHNQRAIYIARHEGMDAIGFNARDVGARDGLRTRVRERFARVRTVLDLRLLGTRPRFLGPRIAIGEARDGNPPTLPPTAQARAREGCTS